MHAAAPDESAPPLRAVVYLGLAAQSLGIDTSGIDGDAAALAAMIYHQQQELRIVDLVPALRALAASGQTDAQIARRLGCSRNAVFCARRAAGIPFGGER